MRINTVGIFILLVLMGCIDHSHENKKPTKPMSCEPVDVLLINLSEPSDPFGNELFFYRNGLLLKRNLVNTTSYIVTQVVLSKSERDTLLNRVAVLCENFVIQKTDESGIDYPMIQTLLCCDTVSVTSIQTGDSLMQKSQRSLQEYFRYLIVDEKAPSRLDEINWSHDILNIRHSDKDSLEPPSILVRRYLWFLFNMDFRALSPIAEDSVVSSYADSSFFILEFNNQLISSKGPNWNEVLVTKNMVLGKKNSGVWYSIGRVNTNSLDTEKFYNTIERLLSEPRIME